jgi:cytochrome c oxidase assembly protein subunit 11
MEPSAPRNKRRAGLGLTAALCAVFVAAMVGASFAAVPLYKILCQFTG